MTGKLTEEEMLQAVKMIIRSGRDAEVRRANGGKYVVYPLDKRPVKPEDLPAGDDAAAVIADSARFIHKTY